MEKIKFEWERKSTVLERIRFGATIVLVLIIFFISLFFMNNNGEIAKNACKYNDCELKSYKSLEQKPKLPDKSNLLVSCDCTPRVDKSIIIKRGEIKWVG